MPEEYFIKWMYFLNHLSLLGISVLCVFAVSELCCLESAGLGLARTKRDLDLVSLGH